MNQQRQLVGDSDHIVVEHTSIDRERILLRKRGVVKFVLIESMQSKDCFRRLECLPRDESWRKSGRLLPPRMSHQWRRERSHLS